MSVLEVAGRILVDIIRTKVPDDIELVGNAVVGIVDKWKSGALGDESALAGLKMLDDTVKKDRALAREELKKKHGIAEEP